MGSKHATLLDPAAAGFQPVKKGPSAPPDGFLGLPGQKWAPPGRHCGVWLITSQTQAVPTSRRQGRARTYPRRLLSCPCSASSCHCIRPETDFQNARAGCNSGSRDQNPAFSVVDPQPYKDAPGRPYLFIGTPQVTFIFGLCLRRGSSGTPTKGQRKQLRAWGQSGARSSFSGATALFYTGPWQPKR